MADLGAQPDRYRTNPYGPASSFQRDAAFSEIFGGSPPPGRSQTMTSQTPQFSQDRAYTMSSHTPEPYIHPRQQPAPMRQMNPRYGPNAPVRHHSPQWQ